MHLLLEVGLLQEGLSVRQGALWITVVTVCLRPLPYARSWGCLFCNTAIVLDEFFTLRCMCLLGARQLQKLRR